MQLELRVKQIWVQILALLLGKWLSSFWASVSSFAKIGIKNSISLRDLLWGFSRIISIHSWHIVRSQYIVAIICCCSIANSCPTLCNFIGCSPPGSSVCGVLQARILEWGAISFSRGFSWIGDPTGQCLLHWQADSSLLSQQGSPVDSMWPL